MTPEEKARQQIDTILIYRFKICIMIVNE